jgi:hypothetical protein
MAIKLMVGANYVARQEGFTDTIDVGGVIEPLIYPAQEKRFAVLPKPKRVIADDGDSETEIDTPDHLMEEDWYFVRYLPNGERFWFNAEGWDSIMQIAP